MINEICKILITTLFLIGISSGVIFAQGKFSGYMFGDYYYILKHNNSDLKDQNGFWLRRIYFTYDYKISDEWSTRFRLELNSPGDFKTKDTIKTLCEGCLFTMEEGEECCTIWNISNPYLGIY
ncbi:MAG: hypothetical protein ACUVUG_04905 [Candidatus Aminicenantia bacterium]